MADALRIKKYLEEHQVDKKIIEQIMKGWEEISDNRKKDQKAFFCSSDQTHG